MNVPTTLRRIAVYLRWIWPADAILLERAALMFERMERTLDEICTDAAEQDEIDARRERVVHQGVMAGQVARLVRARRAGL